MGVLLAYLLFAVCWLLPAFLIFRSGRAGGRDKWLWMLGSVLSAFVPVLMVVLGIVAAVHLGGYERDLKAVAMGPEAAAMALANLLALVLPWVVYFVFRRRHRP